eukprot:COSAG02_NODE_4491_length_5296_cov_107.763299_2_plen_172_part_00
MCGTHRLSYTIVAQTPARPARARGRRRPRAPRCTVAPARAQHPASPPAGGAEDARTSGAIGAAAAAAAAGARAVSCECRGIAVSVGHSAGYDLLLLLCALGTRPAVPSPTPLARLARRVSWSTGRMTESMLVRCRQCVWAISARCAAEARSRQDVHPRHERAPGATTSVQA